MKEVGKLTNIGELDIEKGDIRVGHKLYAWDGVHSCEAVNCVVYDKCDFLKRGKCGVAVKYLSSLIKSITSTYKYLDDVQHFKIGMQIIPLYSMLLRLKLIEMSLKQDDLVITGKVKYVHPVYKEIRQTMVTISMMWKDMAMAPSIKEFGEGDLEGGDDDKGDVVYGDSSYHKKISLVKPRNVVR